MNEIFNQILTEEERVAIEALVGNKRTFEAVRKVMLAGIFYNGVIEKGGEFNPAQNFILSWPFAVETQGAQVSDADLGADVRAEVKAIRKVEQAFGEMKKIKGKSDKGTTPPKNRAK